MADPSKRKYVAGLKKYASKGVAEGLRKKYVPSAAEPPDEEWAEGPTSPSEELTEPPLVGAGSPEKHVSVKVGKPVFEPTQDELDALLLELPATPEGGVDIGSTSAAAPPAAPMPEKSALRGALEQFSPLDEEQLDALRAYLASLGGGEPKNLGGPEQDIAPPETRSPELLAEEE